MKHDTYAFYQQPHGHWTHKFQIASFLLKYLIRFNVLKTKEVSSSSEGTLSPLFPLEEKNTGLRMAKFTETYDQNQGTSGENKMAEE